jgi:ADP-ribose pyrophosphatase YjhB (NUDIX family)
MIREYPAQPLVGVGVVVLRGRAVLLVRRGRPPAQGSWSLPGGLLEVGETGAQGAAREVAEETGLSVELGPLLTVVERIDRDEAARVRYHYVLLEYLAFWQAGEPLAADDAADAIWASVDDLESFTLWSKTVEVIGLALAAAEAQGRAG